MNWEEIRGNWSELKGKLRTQWGKLTDQDIEYIGGARDRLIGALKQRYGYEKERALKEADDWIAKLETMISKERRHDDERRS